MGILLRGMLGSLLLGTQEIWNVGQEQEERGVQAILLTFQVLSDPVGLTSEDPVVGACEAGPSGASYFGGL